MFDGLVFKQSVDAEQISDDPVDVAQDRVRLPCEDSFPADDLGLAIPQLKRRLLNPIQRELFVPGAIVQHDQEPAVGLSSGELARVVDQFPHTLVGTGAGGTGPIRPVLCSHGGEGMDQFGEHRPPVEGSYSEIPRRRTAAGLSGRGRQNEGRGVVEEGKQHERNVPE